MDAPWKYVWFPMHKLVLKRLLHRNTSLSEVSFANKHIDKDAVSFTIVFQSLLEHIFHLVLIGTIQSHALSTVTTGNNLIVGELDKKNARYQRKLANKTEANQIMKKSKCENAQCLQGFSSPQCNAG